MDLRPELLPPSVPQLELDELCREIERIAGMLTADQAGAERAIAAFNARTGHDYGPLDFAEYDGSRDLVDLAVEAARPARPRVPGITRDELVELVRRVLAAAPESHHCLRLLDANVPHPRMADLIFHPPARLRDASAVQIVDEALRYRPIALPGGRSE
ncbi:hypothetical protein [Kitasatospora paranensis]|uniref:Uncharacterized protein n=1 Tax=Kitasatospora paranensis TaxID=258053 RepID=A0ABW2G1X7_9ACTN